MDILESLVGYNVKVQVRQGEDSYLVSGKLKEVDSNGILLLQNGDKLSYFKHFDYTRIDIVKAEQKSQGVFSAFRIEYDGLFDE